MTTADSCGRFRRGFPRLDGMTSCLKAALAAFGCGCMLSLSSCASAGPRPAPREARLEANALIITEVAQNALFAESRADKVEVYCSNAQGCASFRVCDTGSNCSALQPGLPPQAHAVVSRGSAITATDEVWLATEDGSELENTRAGPFPCEAGMSRARTDCSGAAFGACSGPGLAASSGSCEPPETSEPVAYRIRFTTNQHGAPEAGCTRPICQDLLGAINDAQSSIDFAVYGIRAQDHVIEALTAAQARGVSVRGVVDTEDSACTKFGYGDTPRLIEALGPDRVHCDVGSGVSYIMHNKFFVIDEALVWTGSTNLSDTELGGEYNSDVAALLFSQGLAEIYRAEFEEMWTGGRFHKRKTDDTPHELVPDFLPAGAAVRSYFSPTDRTLERAVLPLIDAASSTLDIAMFFFTSDAVAEALEHAADRGVRVRMILDASGAANSASQHGRLCERSIPVRIETWGGKSHSKWAVADAGTSNAAVIFGSMNWTEAGDSQNDENTLYVKDSDFTEPFRVEFERQWADLEQVPLCSAVSAEGAESSVCGAAGCAVSCSSGSCCDGIDNDHDGKIDLAEESCACSDGVDNDGDGYVDAADFDCQNVVDP